MGMALTVTQTRLQRLTDERIRIAEKCEDLLRMAEDEDGRELNEHEQAQYAKYREQIENLDVESKVLAQEIDRANESVDASAHIRVTKDEADQPGSPVHYRTFGQYARDLIIVQRPDLISPAAGESMPMLKAEAQERLDRTLQNVTSTTVEGLIQPTHMTEIMDIIMTSRPVASSGRSVPLDRGSLTYPQIGTRPTVTRQTAEKTEAGTIAPTVATRTLTALTYLGATDISWQALNWSNPNVLNLYFQLAGEAYAMATENAACDALEDAAIGTVGTASGRLGTAGTESFSQWRAAVSAGLQAIYAATGGRHRTNTLYLAANRFFQLATLGTDQVTQMSPVGNLDVGSMTGSFFGLGVVGSYGLDQDTAIIGDSNALLVGENPGSPVEMRVVEPNIAGYQVGLVGAFAAVVFDVNRFANLGTHL